MSYSSVVLADNPIRYYRLGEASGTVAVDIGSQAQNGTLSGGITLSQAGLLTGDADTAMLFDGTSGVISASASSMPAGAAAWSMECWIKMPGTLPGGVPTCMGFGDTGAGALKAVLFFYSGDSKIYLGDANGGVVNTAAVTGGSSHHIVATYDGTNARMYDNGVLVAGPTAHTWNITDTFVQIGNDATGDYWSGIIDEAAFYSVALSSGQVTAHYTAGITAPAPLSHVAGGGLLRFTPRALSGTIVQNRYRPRALQASIGTLRAKGYVLRGLQATLIRGGQAESPYPNAVIADKPVLYYRLNEGIGTAVTDFTGGGYDGTLSTGVTLQQSGYSALDADTSMLLTGPASVSIPFNLLKPYTWTSLSLEYLVNIASGWQHIVTTIDAAGNILHYLNGVKYNHLPPYLPRGLSATLVNPPISSDPILVDLDMFYSGSYNAGDLDEVALYNYVLSPTQIATHYNAAFIVSLFETLSGVGRLSGTLSANLALALTMTGVGTLTGTLTETTALTTTLPGVGTLAETFTLATALSTTLAGVGQLLPTLSANLALAVEFDGIGTLTGTLGDSTALTCTLAGVGTLSGTLSTTAGVSLSVTMAGIGTLAGTLSANTALSTTLVGVGTLTGTTSLTTALSTTLVGTGTLAGTLSAKTALTSTLAGAGTLAGTMALSTALGCQLVGTGTLTGVFSLRVALSLTFAGIGNISGTLTIPSLSFLSATCVTRDMQATCTTRDEQATALTRDEQATAKTRS